MFQSAWLATGQIKALTRALMDAARFGGIGVLEYSPAGQAAGMTMTSPSHTTAADVQRQAASLGMVIGW